MNCLPAYYSIGPRSRKQRLCTIGGVVAILSAVAAAGHGAEARPVGSTMPLVIRQPPPSRAGTTRPTTATPTPARATSPTKVTPTPPPRVTPRPTAPPVARPYVYPYVPPLSPEEARALVLACIKILTINDPSTHASRCHKVREILGKSVTYLTLLDQRHSTLASYKWHFIDEEKVELGVETDEFEVKPVIARVSAISFAARYGDVFIYSAVVYDDKGTSSVFKINRPVEHKFPREEICYLVFPTTLKKVVVRYQKRRERSRKPRLSLYAGVAGEEEYLKQALGHLRDARHRAGLAASDRKRASQHIEAACKDLRRAAERIRRFRQKQKY
jgi:hypothetical protein